MSTTCATCMGHTRLRIIIRYRLIISSQFFTCLTFEDFIGWSLISRDFVLLLPFTGSPVDFRVLLLPLGALISGSMAGWTTGTSSRRSSHAPSLRCNLTSFFSATAPSTDVVSVPVLRLYTSTQDRASVATASHGTAPLTIITAYVGVGVRGGVAGDVAARSEESHRGICTRQSHSRKNQLKQNKTTSLVQMLEEGTQRLGAFRTKIIKKTSHRTFWS